MNDVMFMETAREMGSDLAGMKRAVRPTATAAFRRVLTRPPSEDELSAIVEFFQQQHDRFAANPDSAGKVAGPETDHVIDSASWTMVVRALFSLDEAVTRN
jgi:hypothetical protein